MQELEMSAVHRACGRRCFICDKPLRIGEKFTEIPMGVIEEQPRVAAWKSVVTLPYVVEVHWDHFTDKQKRR